MPLFIRETVEREMRERLASGESIASLVAWLGKSGATVGEAVEMLDEVAGLSRTDAKTALTSTPIGSGSSTSSAA